MNNKALSTLRKIFSLHSGWQTQCVISLVFLILIGVSFWSLNRYWQLTLKPRLYTASETHAKVLAESQASALLEILSHSEASKLQQTLQGKIHEMLIVEDPAIGERFIQHVSLQIDYSQFDVEEGILDVNEGNSECQLCFRAEVPLINRDGMILGIAEFSISDAYFQHLSTEMKSKLFTDTSFSLALVATVWIVMMLMFHRLHSAKKLIEASDLAKTRFMANVTHELRTPLNAILGYTQLYRQNETLMQEHGQGIDTIDRSAEHLLLMINDILEFSRANEESLSLHPHEVSLANFLKTLVEMTWSRARLKNIEFDHDFTNELPRAIYVDEKRLRQILLNLLSNAVKFTEKGNVSFSVSTLRKHKDQTVDLRFSIKDTGIGIAKHQMKTIFIPFQQLDNAITRAEGSGLGLTISQRLLSLMHSTLQIESEPNKGSCFWFDLNIKAIGENTPVEKSETPEQSPPITLPEPQFLIAFKDEIKRHNVLGIRQKVNELKEQNEYQAFINYIQPYLQHYRFQALLEWLEKQDEDNQHSPD